MVPKTLYSRERGQNPAPPQNDQPPFSGALPPLIWEN